MFVICIESLYRTGIRYALSIRSSTNNEILYIEANCIPLYIQVKKQQLRFWLTIQQLIRQDPENVISKLIVQAEALHLQYIKYYNDLCVKYQTPTKCYKDLMSDFITVHKSKILEENDTLSKLGAYRDVNPTLCNPNYANVFEIDRIRFDTGWDRTTYESKQEE